MPDEFLHISYTNTNTAAWYITYGVAAHQDNVGDRYDDEAAGEQGAQVGADPLGGVHLLGDSLEVFLVLGDCVKVVADDGAEARVDVEDGLLEGEGVTVHLHFPLPRSETTEEQEAVFLCRTI